ncbi:MAG: O-acetyl-ADP-ribose deacetylase [Bacteroidetes bacterium HGW-Bacteroidetes-17]|jgi:O-acetyl-ADP-ribose deacetylase (regulator of RNase III)|nr:MAG: O-acetyl-ADP-ribose deacetylase [Bacteroidetes bacterium HGW-Bacteroidetes-17]
MAVSIQLLQGDITKLKVDVIVNAANNSLLGGGGVDGAIHRAAGPELLKECKTLNGCETGKAKITKAYKLPSKHIIHTVGPIWTGGQSGEIELLRNCYHECLNLAKVMEFKTIAFPNISTGVYGFPKSQAAEIALNEVSIFSNLNDIPLIIYFVCFDIVNYELYRQKLPSFRL